MLLRTGDANPLRDIPRAILVAGLLIAAFNVLGTFGVLAAVPSENTDVTRIFAESLYQIYGHDGLSGTFASMTGCFVLFTMLTNMVTWNMGTNRAAVAAAKAGELPQIFAVVHPRYQTPIGPALLASAVSIVVMLVYGLVANSAEELFWTLLSIFAMIFMMPYVLMSLAFIKLRLSAPQATAVSYAAGQLRSQLLGRFRRATRAGRNHPVRSNPGRTNELEPIRPDSRWRLSGSADWRVSDPRSGRTAPGKDCDCVSTDCLCPLLSKPR